MTEDEKGFTKILEHFGFTGVKVKNAPLPEHIINWIKEEDEDFDVADLKEEDMVYLSATTNQGSFGVFLAVYPVIDLKNTGLSIKDLCPEADDVPAEFFLCGFEAEIVIKFKELLEAKQTRS